MIMWETNSKIVKTINKYMFIMIATSIVLASIFYVKRMQDVGGFIIIIMATITLIWFGTIGLIDY